jgi:ATP-dependent helicase/DNAse subunit B
MKRLFLPAMAALVAGMLLTPPLPSQTASQTVQQEEPEPTRLPNGKLQTDEILKADHEKSLKDAAQLVALSQSLKEEIEKDDAHVLSISSLKKTEEIEKIARRIRSRMKHY